MIQLTHLPVKSDLEQLAIFYLSSPETNSATQSFTTPSINDVVHVSCKIKKYIMASVIEA